MNCKICQSPSVKAFETKVLYKYPATYYTCTACGFLQPGTPHWLQESYSSAITSLDLGLLKRNLELREVVAALIRTYFNASGKMLDYGGGYGVLVRLLRDKGFDFYRQDMYADNLFARHFDLEDAGVQKFELLTAFEVFEHLEDPVEEVRKMLEYSDSILFSTELQPHANPTPESWWYVLPEIGQHISLFSRQSLEALARQFKLNLYSNGKNLHLLTRKKIGFPLLFKALSYHQISGMYNHFLIPRKSLLSVDFDRIRKGIEH